MTALADNFVTLHNPLTMNSLRAYSLSFLTVFTLFSFLVISHPAKAQTADIDEQIWTEGRSLFRTNCASCHNPVKKMTGPALEGVTERWDEAGEFQGKDGKEWLYEWIRNWEDPVAAGYPYAIEMKDFDPSAMNIFEKLSDEDIEKILLYSDNSTAFGAPVASADDGGSEDAGGLNMNTLMIVLCVLLVLLALVLWRVTTVLNKIALKKAGQDVPAAVPFYKNKKLITLVGLVLLIIIGYAAVDNATALGRQQRYQPTQPIAYSHELHAGVHQIDCEYCHHAARTGKHANIPSMNVCMNCHKAVSEGPTGSKTEIAKIYASIGWNPNETNSGFIKDYTSLSKGEVRSIFTEWLADELDGTALDKYLDKELMPLAQKPIEWVRIHNLPDHVYFNHAQHVNVGGVECETCHGPIDEMEEVYQHAPLSMGWCINCHRTTKVDFNGNGYYSSVYARYDSLMKMEEINSVTVEDIGGTSCQKCHY